MPICRWTPLLAAAFAFGQEAVPFPMEKPEPWKPAWELLLRGDQLSDPGEPSDRFHRVGVQLRLRWNWDLEAVQLEAGTRSAMGSDSNRDNSPRWDQQPSNGTQVDVARIKASWTAPRSFGTLSLGFQENGLVTSQALWDRNLRFLGAGGSAGFRSADGLLQEAGLRLAAGRVRDVLGAKADLAAGQLVVKMDTGAFSWLAHVDRWSLSWEAGDERRRALPGHRNEARQRLALAAIGASGTWHARLPLEAHWFRSRNAETRETSEEFQAIAGSRERLYWPQLAVTWQRLGSTGTLYPVNGDEWWFYRRARGQRFDMAVPLPGQWLASIVYIRQRSDGDGYQVTRKLLTLVKRF